ncbi:hypothetical protein ACQVSN_27010 [Bacillus mobilis]|uniref:hypothetical protein n=1 Tax=Bacillus mobilis TaxID=2026190 RepID=UPI003D6574D8
MTNQLFNSNYGVDGGVELFNSVQWDPFINESMRETVDYLLGTNTFFDPALLPF